jgi:MoxR-like ATPase
MQERSVTIAGENYKLDLPYFVLAHKTQLNRRNLSPGTIRSFYVCYQAQYPSFAEEVQVVNRQLQ